MWDVRCETYNDRGRKQSAWLNVCKSMFIDFETILLIDVFIRRV